VIGFRYRHMLESLAVPTPTTSAFLPGAGASDAWELARAQIRQPRPARPSLEYVNEELALRDLMARYAYTWDSGDIDALMDFFLPDAELTNSRGSASGRDAIRANYEAMHRDLPHQRHLFGNQVVRLSVDLTRAWTCVYHYGVLDTSAAVSRNVAGVICDTLVKRGDEWRIQSRAVCIDVAAACPPYQP
jgi:uncharacterized protein (TIGR02246 family)